MASESLATEDEGKAWEDALRKMLPAGAPLPDEEHLDYSIAVEYQGPPVPYQVPKVDPLDLDSIPVRASTVSTVSDLSLIPVAMPIHPKHNRFNRIRNGNGNGNGVGVGGYSRELNTPEERHRFSPASASASASASRTQFELQSSNEEGREFTNGIREVEDSEEPNVNGEGKRAPVVTFNTPRDSEEDESDAYSSAAEFPVGSRGEKEKWWSRKRGVCSRCGKGNRLKEREPCMVCDAKYCSNCVLKAMGSMPEGRKCVSCIGQPIDEARRGGLGKISRILTKVCSPLEIKQIMKAEKECASNQLRPEQLVVNGRQLRQEELAEILGCSMAPQKLKPGKYWYDKDSGLWGKVGETKKHSFKLLFFLFSLLFSSFMFVFLCFQFGLQEGEKPDRIISSKLNVGGKLKQTASNGNTKVYINGREITKIELRVLKVCNSTAS